LTKKKKCLNYNVMLEKGTDQNRDELIWRHADVPAGVYFYHLKTPTGEVGGKLTIIR
jgi:hypothetical protein